MLASVRGGETPEHKVHAVAAHYPNLINATKGYAARSTLLSMNRIEFTRAETWPSGTACNSRLDSDIFKGRTHERLSWPEDARGACHFPEDVTDDFLKQLVSEVRVTNDSGQVEWIQRNRDNHWLDATALADAAGYFVGVQRIRNDAQRPAPQQAAASPSQSGKPATAAPQAATQPRKQPFWGPPGTEHFDEERAKMKPLTDRGPSLTDIGKSEWSAWDDL